MLWVHNRISVESKGFRSHKFVRHADHADPDAAHFLLYDFVQVT